MTLKRKIFISNIMTLIITLMLTVLVVFIAALIYMNVAGIADTKALFEKNNFNRSVFDVSELAQNREEDKDIILIRDSVDDFNSRYGKDDIMLYIYIGAEPVFADLVIDPAVIAKLSNFEGESIIVSGDRAYYNITSGDYKFITVAKNYSIDSYKFNIGNFNPGFIVAAILIFAVIMTSFLFSRYLTKSITRPIDILINGVREISAGNLSYRIDYAKKDEFSVVCADFNEMARRLNDSVEQRGKDEASRKELIAGISHDLRSPLTSIKAYLEGIEKGVANTPELRSRYFNTIKNKTSELENIIEQLFLFSKIDIGEYPFHFERTEITALLTGFINDIQDEYKNKGLSVRTCFENDNLNCEIDIQQFRNIITNIIENSVKYKDKENGELIITAKERGGKNIIEISDDGPGVPEDMLDKIFGVFYRCDSSRNNKKPGSGLGLAIASKVIERMNGGIRAENNPGGGLTVIITLPAA